MSSPPSRSLRLGVARAFIAVIWAGLLVVPVGIETDAGPVPASVGEALAELAGGDLGVGILGGLVAGGALASSALVRVALVVLAMVAFWLAGQLGPPPEEPRRVRRRRCPHCGSWASRDMSQCPYCGKSFYT